MKISDDILNRYIDGELNSSELNEVREALKTSGEARKNYNALLIVHQELIMLKEDKVSSGFTTIVMSKLSKGFKVRKEDRYFIFSISSIFVIICLVILGFILSNIISSAGASSGSLEIIDNLILLTDNITSSIIKMFSGKGISIFGSIISFGILISAYFFFENNKNLKKN